LRLEATHEDLSGNKVEFDSAGNLEPVTPIRKNYSYLDPLPSVQVRFAIGATQQALMGGPDDMEFISHVLAFGGLVNDAVGIAALNAHGPGLVVDRKPIVLESGFEATQGLSPFQPQHLAPPALVITQVWASPAEMAVAPR
jgi:hypothetical protein